MSAEIQSDTTAAKEPRESVFGFRQVMSNWWTLEPTRQGSQSMYLLATLIYNSLFGVILTIAFLVFDRNATLWKTLWQTLLVSNCIGFSIHGLMELFFGWLAPRRKWVFSKHWQRVAISAALAMLGIYLGYTIAFGILGRNFTAMLANYPRFAFGMLLIGLIGCMVWLLFMDGQTRRVRAQVEEARYAEERARLAAQAKGAELRALQAQIEPHFLFNTLANVLALIDYEPQTAKKMLDSFITHLRQSLDTSRQTHATLGGELDLLRSYLQLLEIRMANRLKFVIDCPEELRDTPFAPLLLQPLVENAVKYGLEPKIEGGTVTIRASKNDGAIRIDVEDDGVGLHTKSTARAGTGTGIANVRERLASIYGARAALEVKPVADSKPGTVSSIIIAE
ncbi:MAG: sensor histidine kinase [Casimicrobium sp.]